MEYSGDDIEETFMQTFSISYKDVFGVVYNHELKAVFYTQIIQNFIINNYNSFIFKS